MKKYILTVIGSFESEKMCQDLALSLTPIVDSPHMKFQHTNGVLLFHFASEVSKDEIYDYIVGILFGVTEAFILTEMHDNLTLSMPKDIKEHLLDLDNATDSAEMKIDMNRIKRNFDFLDEEEDDDFVALLLGEKNNLFKKPSLDQILDKMLDKGYESLTEFEKDILKSYSKN
jgi:hypothetical protein